MDFFASFGLAAAGLPQPGGYIDPIKLAALFVLAIPWLWVASWIDKDAKTARMPEMVWSLAMLASGAVGMLAWLLVPVYIVGLGVYVVLTCAVAAVYIMQRNGRVAPDARVLTPEHLAKLFQGKGRRSGVAVQTRIKVYDHKNGPVEVPTQDDSAEIKATYNFTQELLYEMIWRRVSEAVITTSTQPFKYVVDGVVISRDAYEPAQTNAVIDYLKTVGGMDVQDKRRPQKGKIIVDLARQPVDITLNSDGSTNGQRTALQDRAGIAAHAHRRVGHVRGRAETRTRDRQQAKRPDDRRLPAGQRPDQHAVRHAARQRRVHQATGHRRGERRGGPGERDAK